MATSRQPISFHDARLEVEIESRTPPGDSNNLTAKRDLNRYYRLLDIELRRVWLTEPEASLIVDALNGVTSEATTMPLVWAVVDDAIRLQGLAAKWHITDPGGLVLRLRDLSPAQCFALADAVERFWAEPREDIAAGLEAVGLIQRP